MELLSKKELEFKDLENSHSAKMRKHAWGRTLQGVAKGLFDKDSSVSVTCQVRSIINISLLKIKLREG